MGGEFMAKRGRKKQPLSARQMKAIQILCSPEGLEMTQGQLAKKLGVSDSTISRWHEDTQFQKALEEQIKRQYFRMLPYARQCLYDRMKKDTQALKLFFSLIGQYKEQMEISGVNSGPIRLSLLSKMSDEELEKLKKDLGG